MTHDALAARELCERLRRTTCVQIDPERQAIRSLNPDGPAAADLLELLLADLTAANARVKEAETQPLETAPKDGTMLWLLVSYEDAHSPDGEADHPLADAVTAWTIGFNNLDHDGEDEWKFAGWCWSHDHFTEGRGKVLAWKPVGFEIGADTDPCQHRPAAHLQGVGRMKNDPVYAAAAALIRRTKDADAIATVGYRQAIEPFLGALESAQWLADREGRSDAKSS